MRLLPERQFYQGKSFLKQVLSLFLFQTLLGSISPAFAAESLSVVSGLELSSHKFFQLNLKETKIATVLLFLSTRCPCSNSHLPALNALAQEFSPLGFEFVGIHSNANEELAESFDHFQRAKLQFPVIQDNEGKIADYFRAHKTPHVFVVSPTGKMLFQGGVDNSRLLEKADRHYLKDALLALKNGKEPPEKEVRVLGCQILRK